MVSTEQLSAGENQVRARDPYQVLARRYRPQKFSEIIGQDDCVRILTHAIQTQRVGHAFLFVGERGVGKTTLARLLARALNCVGLKDQRGAEGVDPCGVCFACVDIAQDRQLDILEMDAASHTGVDDVRSIIEGARYRPATLTFKVFIIDEVHMLSKNAFNALLKTLEEPPPHVKFIFATTELQKVPLTIRSRCQFFDLKKVSQSTLEVYFKSLSEKEGIPMTPEALRLIVRGADGSVRDGLSLLDQAFNYDLTAVSGGEIQEAHIRQMFGLCDRRDMVRLFTLVMKGAQEEVLLSFDEVMAQGQDPYKILQDFLEICYQITRYKCSSSYDLSLFDQEVQETLKDLSSRLSMEVLHRTWQVLAKGMEEVKGLDLAALACGMVLIRVMYIQGILSRDETSENFKDVSVIPLPQARLQGGGVPHEDFFSRTRDFSEKTVEPALKSSLKSARDSACSSPSSQKDLSGESLENFSQILAFLKERKEMRLYTDLYAYGRFVSLDKRTLTLSLPDGASWATMRQNLEIALKKHTGNPWTVVLSTQAEGQIPCQEQDELLEQECQNYVQKDPVVQEILKTFPQSRVELVNRVEQE